MKKQDIALEMIKDFREVFGTAAGKRVLENLEQESRINELGGVCSHEQYAYMQGKKDIILIIKKILTAEPDIIKSYIDNIKENKSNGNI